MRFGHASHHDFVAIASDSLLVQSKSLFWCLLLRRRQNKVNCFGSRHFHLGFLFECDTAIKILVVFNPFLNLHDV